MSSLTAECREVSWHCETSNVALSCHQKASFFPASSFVSAWPKLCFSVLVTKGGETTIVAYLFSCLLTF